ncbi:MAG: hypothetical protein HYV67_02675 [Candidatus Taylorbacteria bacterium]|nr:hypothetical protein [Candidatus Taylorbacteria bacterium]
MVEKIKNEISDGKNIFRFLTAGVVVSLGLYVYLVSSTVINAVERQKAEKSIIALEGSVEKLETAYSNLKRGVTVDLARSKGFTGISSATFITRKSLGKVLSLNNEI